MSSQSAIGTSITRTGGQFLPAFSTDYTGTSAPPTQFRTQMSPTSTVTVFPSSSPPTSTSTAALTSDQAALRAAPTLISSPSSAPPSIVTSRASGGVPAVGFYGFAGGIVVLIVVAGGVFWYRGTRIRAKRAGQVATAARLQTLVQTGELRDDLEWSLAPPIPVLQSSARSWTSSEWDARSNATPRRALEPSAGRPTPGRSALQDAGQRGHLARVDALQEGKIKAEAERRARFAALSQADELARDHARPADDGSHSDGSAFDLDRRGPAVNAAYAAARDRRFKEKLALGMTFDEALSTSDASTDVGDFGDHGLFSGRRRPIVATLPTPQALLGVADPVTPGDGTQLAPTDTPTRRRATAMAAAAEGEPFATIEEATSSRLSQIDLAFTDDTATRASVAISDDPWREDVLENRRKGR
ncbi:MAG: hypothetical protein M1838_000563 [Thelocarpon superellum]|nr:MAG: hypothetical protein M1838_000563 [Thelocarpon superellum]